VTIYLEIIFFLAKDANDQVVF